MGHDKIWVEDALGNTILNEDEFTGKWKPVDNA